MRIKYINNIFYQYSNLSFIANNLKLLSYFLIKQFLSMMKNNKTNLNSLSPSSVKLPPVIISKQSISLNRKQSKRSLKKSGQNNHALRKLVNISNTNQSYQIKVKESNRTNSKTNDRKIRKQNELSLVQLKQRKQRHNSEKLQLQPNRVYTQGVASKEYQQDYDEYGNDNTLINFQKQIAENKKTIKKQMRGMNRLSGKKVTNHQLQLTKSYSRKNRKHTESPKTLETTLFPHLCKFLDRKIHLRSTNSLPDDQTNLVNSSSKKINNIVSKIRKLSQGNSSKTIDEESFVQKSHSKAKIKNQANYSEWRRIDIADGGTINYLESSFDIEQSKLNQFIDRNDASIIRYLESKKQLLKLKMQAEK